MSLQSRLDLSKTAHSSERWQYSGQHLRRLQAQTLSVEPTAHLSFMFLHLPSILTRAPRVGAPTHRRYKLFRNSIDTACIVTPFRVCLIRGYKIWRHIEFSISLTCEGVIRCHCHYCRAVQCDWLYSVITIVVAVAWVTEICYRSRKYYCYKFSVTESRFIKPCDEVWNIKLNETATTLKCSIWYRSADACEVVEFFEDTNSCVILKLRSDGMPSVPSSVTLQQ